MSEAYQGTLVSFDDVTYVATVKLRGSASGYVPVHVSRAIPITEMVTGRLVHVTLFDPSNPTDGVVTAVYE